MIQLPKAYTQEHQQLTLKYLAEGRRVLSSAEWKKLLTGFDVLHKASIITPTERMTFAEWYERQIDRVFAEPFIAALLRLENVAREQEALRARFAREIVQTWTASELRQQERSVGNVLMAYCLYFWESFATGYAFEVEIYRDLRKEGIAFVAHDIRNRLARFSAYDLKVLNLRGDIKTSLYFLEVERGRKLPHDFYITRFYEGSRQRTLVVMLQVEAWQQIDGETIAGLLAEATQHFPSPVAVTLPAGTVVIADYALWKQKVFQRQREEEETDEKKNQA